MPTKAAISAWTAPSVNSVPFRRNKKDRTLSTSFAVVFPQGAEAMKSGPLWVTRPTLTRNSKKKEIIRIVSVFPVVIATTEKRPRFQWTVDISAAGQEWMELLPAGYLMTLKGGLRVLEALMKSNSLSFRGGGGITTMTKTGPDHATYRLYNIATGEEIISDILQNA